MSKGDLAPRTVRAELAQLLRHRDDSTSARRYAAEAMTFLSAYGDAVLALLADAAPALDEERLADAIARWLHDEPRSYSVAGEYDRGMADYGYSVAMAEIRSILRDPTGELTTEEPSPAELRHADRLLATRSDEATA